jgi:alpha-tubulin suppressor-like RCC1 family protein
LFNNIYEGNGDTYAWGWNEHGNLGFGHKNNVYEPKKLNIKDIKNVFIYII